MNLPESAAGTASALDWKTYSVRAAGRAPLLKFIVDGLVARGCRVLSTTAPNKAPFYIVFETPSGSRQGVLAYAFFANSRQTGGRPRDEHRFQVKYGSELKGVLEIAVDPHELITTILVGIDTARGLFVAADPLMHNPSPMSRSIEFKASHAEEIAHDGWVAWERDRHKPKTKTRPTAEIDEDTRIEVLVGGSRDRIFDLIQLERIARGLDPGERHHVADELGNAEGLGRASAASHSLLRELELPPEALFDLIDGASRLKMAVRGWVAEAKLVDHLSATPGVTDCRRLEGEGMPDVSLRWRGGPPILVECKNTLRKADARGHARVDFQRTRASKGDPCSRYYRPSDFQVLAACLHAVSGEWKFQYAVTGELPPHKSCPGRISNGIAVAEPLFTDRPELVFSKCSA